MNTATRTSEHQVDATVLGRPLRVLIVDDSRDAVMAMALLLRTEGHDTKACYSGEQVLAYVRDYEPDVVLLDIGLPVRSGWDLAQEIQSRYIQKRPMLIGITGEYVKGVDRILAEMSGFDYYLLKPVDPKVLSALLKKAAEPQ